MNKETKSVRLAKRGDIIRTIDFEDVVRDVSVIIHFANGVDVRFHGSAYVDVVEEEIPEEVVALADEIEP